MKRPETTASTMPITLKEAGWARLPVVELDEADAAAEDTTLDALDMLPGLGCRALGAEA